MFNRLLRLLFKEPKLDDSYRLIVDLSIDESMRHEAFQEPGVTYPRLILKVLFWNDTPNKIRFAFDDAYYEAALNHLEVCDTQGNELEGKQAIDVVYSSRTPQLHTVKPGSVYAYELPADIKQEKLCFMGAEYPIPENRIMYFTFHYKEKSSNAASIEL